MQSLKKFYFGKQKAKVNTYIGGIGGTINTPALLAAKLGIDENRIKLFKVTGVDVECAIIGGSYSLLRYAFILDQSITYYIDIDGLNTEIYQAFINCNNLKTLCFPNLTSLRGGLGGGWLTNQSLIRAYFPRLIYMGETVGQDEVFRSGYRYSDVLYVPDIHRTSNSGNADGDIQRYVSNGSGASIRYVTNFTPPNPVTNLSVGTIYNTAVQLNFTPPTSVNGVDFYECYANGKLMNEIKNSGEFISGLTPSTNYNIRIVAVDMFYNKSELSNTLNVSTTSNLSDTDATAYTTASSNIAYQYAINDLFKGLKDNSLYTKIQAFYPFLGTTAAQHKWNAKNPLDTNAAFRLQFFGGGTHSNLGYQCNGTDAYANTFLIPSAVQDVNSNGFTVTVGTNNGIVGWFSVEIGCSVSLTSASFMSVKLLNTTYNRVLALNTDTGRLNQSGINEARGIFSGVRQSSSINKLFRNNSSLTNGTSGGTLPNTNIFIGCYNANGTPNGYSNQRIQFTAIHEGLTDAEVVALHTIIDNFESAIGRKTW